MDLQSIINSRFGIGFGLALGRLIPPKMGYWLADIFAEKTSKKIDTAMVKAARLNQWVVSGENLTAEELDEAVLETLRASAQCQYDLYHNLKNPEAFKKLIAFTPGIENVIDAIHSRKQGVLVVGLHLNSLDIEFVAMSYRDVRALGITVPDPGGGYQWQNEMRVDFGFELLPASKNAIRAAMHQLSENGTVVTGIDRPITDMKYRPRFFGRPASLTVVHIVLALKFNLPIYIAVTWRDETGKYYLDGSDPIFMKSRSDRYSEIMYNAEAVLEVAEDYIRKVPRQWAMYYPVWPDAADEMETALAGQ